MSLCTPRSYPCITPPGTVYIDCHASNFIYLIIYHGYGLLYVGETAETLAERFGIIDKTLDTQKNLEVNFSLCKETNHSVQIIEKLEGNGRRTRGAIDPSYTSKRRAREVHWMLKLQTVFSYGLNDRIDEYQREHRNCIGERFPL